MICSTLAANAVEATKVQLAPMARMKADPGWLQRWVDSGGTRHFEHQLDEGQVLVLEQPDHVALVQAQQSHGAATLDALDHLCFVQVALWYAWRERIAHALKLYTHEKVNDVTKFDIFDVK